MYEAGFRDWDLDTAAAATVVLVLLLGALAAGPVRPVRAAGALPMRSGVNPAWPNRVPATGAMWLFGLLWALPLLYAVWAAIHPPLYATEFDLGSPLTLDNFAQAWHAAPFARYFLNTVLLVSFTVAGQCVLATLAGFAFARLSFFGRDVLFSALLLQAY